MSQFIVPMEIPVLAGDIIAAIFNDLVTVYRPAGWYLGLAETNADVFQHLGQAGDAGALIITWGGDDTAEAVSPITRPVVKNVLNVVIKQRSPPTAQARETMIVAAVGRDSFIKSLSDLRRRLVSYRFQVNGVYAFDNDARGPVYSRLRYYSAKPFGGERIATDAYTLNFSFYSPMDMPSMDDSDVADKLMLDIQPVGTKQQ